MTLFGKRSKKGGAHGSTAAEDSLAQDDSRVEMMTVWDEQKRDWVTRSAEVVRAERRRESDLAAALLDHFDGDSDVASSPKPSRRTLRSQFKGLLSRRRSRQPKSTTDVEDGCAILDGVDALPPDNTFEGQTTVVALQRAGRAYAATLTDHLTHWNKNKTRWQRRIRPRATGEALERQTRLLAAVQQLIRKYSPDGHDNDTPLYKGEKSQHWLAPFKKLLVAIELVAVVSEDDGATPEMSKQAIEAAFANLEKLAKLCKAFPKQWAIGPITGIDGAKVRLKAELFINLQDVMNAFNAVDGIRIQDRKFGGGFTRWFRSNSVFIKAMKLFHEDITDDDFEPKQFYQAWIDTYVAPPERTHRPKRGASKRLSNKRVLRKLVRLVRAWGTTGDNVSHQLNLFFSALYTPAPTLTERKKNLLQGNNALQLDLLRIAFGKKKKIEKGVLAFPNTKRRRRLRVAAIQTALRAQPDFVAEMMKVNQDTMAKWLKRKRSKVADNMMRFGRFDGIIGLPLQTAAADWWRVRLTGKRKIAPAQLHTLLTTEQMVRNLFLFAKDKDKGRRTTVLQALADFVVAFINMPDEERRAKYLFIRNLSALLKLIPSDKLTDIITRTVGSITQPTQGVLDSFRASIAEKGIVIEPGSDCAQALIALERRIAEMVGDEAVVEMPPEPARTPEPARRTPPERRRSSTAAIGAALTTTTEPAAISGLDEPLLSSTGEPSTPRRPRSTDIYAANKGRTPRLLGDNSPRGAAQVTTRSRFLGGRVNRDDPRANPASPDQVTTRPRQGRADYDLMPTRLGFGSDDGL